MKIFSFIAVVIILGELGHMKWWVWVLFYIAIVYDVIECLDEIFKS